MSGLCQLCYMTESGAGMAKQIPREQLEDALKRLARRRLEATAYELVDGQRGEAIGWVEDWDHVRGFVWVLDEGAA